MAVAANFVVPPGQTLALVGPSGAGKSSILKAIAGLLPAADNAGAMHDLTRLLLHAFDGSGDIDLESAGQPASQACTSPDAAPSGSAANQDRIASAGTPCG